MSDPYRELVGVECPRCQAILQPRDAGGLGCDHGCGEWIGRTAITTLVGPADLARSGVPAPYFKVTTLPPTACLICRAALVALYRTVEASTYVTLGQCAAHGVWVERRGRADLERAYAAAIARWERAGTLAEQLQAGGLKDAAYKILRLEARVAELEAEIQELKLR